MVAAEESVIKIIFLQFQVLSHLDMHKLTDNMHVMLPAEDQ